MIEDGIVLIDKPKNITSFGVVARVRGKLSRYFNRKVKVGHTGTLDPFATGLMIIVVGKECKKAQEYSKLDKSYEATIVLGKTSSTGDSEGELSEVSSVIPSKDEILRMLHTFLGEIEQTPPIYSAIKVNGQRAYKLARAGEQPEIPSRRVRIDTLELVDFHYPYVQIRTRVSSGTYIRTLAEDIGKVLKTGAYCQELRRTSIGHWQIDEAQKLEDYLL